MLEGRYLRYDGFGKQTASSGSLTNSFQYTGREFDSETGLYFYRARYYDRVACRFISEDPFGMRDNVNMYVYAKNNSVNFGDPFDLYQLKGFPEVGQVLMNFAIKQALEKLRESCPHGVLDAALRCPGTGR